MEDLDAILRKMGEKQRHKSILLDHLARHAYRYRPEEPFVLSSGAQSLEYIDCARALSHPTALHSLGKVVLSCLAPEVVAVGGLTMGADPIAMSTSLESVSTDRHVRWFSVRKEPKVHGATGHVEGDVREGDVVCVVDDVITSGASTIRAITECRRAGLEVGQVVVLVKRSDEGMRKVFDVLGVDIPVFTLFKKGEIAERWRELQDTESDVEEGDMP